MNTNIISKKQKNVVNNVLLDSNFGVSDEVIFLYDAKNTSLTIYVILIIVKYFFQLKMDILSFLSYEKLIKREIIYNVQVSTIVASAAIS